MIKEKWASAFAPRVFSAGTHTSSRVESVNSWLKQTLNHKSSLIELLNTFVSFENRVKQRIRDNKAHSNQIYHHPLLSDMHRHCSKYAFEQMLF